MNRAQKITEARRLRGQGLVLREIAVRLEAGRSTVAEWLSDPDRLKAKARKHAAGQPCVDCGARTAFGAEKARVPKPRCGVCGPAHRIARIGVEKETRRREIERRWLAGETLGVIAAALDSKKGSIGVAISEMRAEGGYNVPHRYAPDVVARMTEINRAQVARRKAARQAAA